MHGRPVRAVLLDVLGTLLALEPPGPAFVGLLASEHGVTIDPGQAERAFAGEMSYYRDHHSLGRDAETLAALRRDCARVLAEGLGGSAAAGLASAEIERAMLASLRFRVHDDVRPALADLRERGVRLVAVSNWDASLPDVLRAAGLAEALDGWVSSAEAGAPKPEPAIFGAALALAGATAQESLHVGDSAANDVAGARAAEIMPVLLDRDPTGDGEPQDLAAPDTVTIASLAELPDLVDRGVPSRPAG